MADSTQPQNQPDFGLSISAASSLCAWSERTVWRKLASGHLLRRSPSGARAAIAWSSLLPHLAFSLDDESIDLLRKADAGCALSQSELALQLIAQRRMVCALHWLHLAAEAGQADAMYWLGRAYLCGDGVAADRNLGLMWLARSAADGHVISDAVLSGLWKPVLTVSRPLSSRDMVG